ncbi:MAG: glucuronate isomerase [Balneolaceae bacterium]
MNTFLTDDFLLQSEPAKRLYHDYVADLPIIDYHSHLPPSEIDENRRFSTITSIWLDGDHYKWRAMRTLGIDEHYITGKASDREKFMMWARTVPYTVRNPLYHWTHLELKNYFGVEKLLNPESADEVYRHCNERITGDEFRARSLLTKMKVEIVCTTDDPLDSLEAHRSIRSGIFPCKVLPTFRPDPSFGMEQPERWNRWVDKLGEITGNEIRSLDKFLESLESRIDFFHKNGCRLADHGLEKIHPVPDSSFHPESVFQAVRDGRDPGEEARHGLVTTILLQLSKMYHERGWVQQFHLGALRNANTRMYRKFGEAAGFDSISDVSHSHSLADFFDTLDQSNQLSKTILYNLNPADNSVMATMAGNYNDGSDRGKVQYGTAWWFLDQKDGMEDQMNILSNMGLLSCFVGMLTDSRSFLSYPRHEYFRRILCNLIGRDVENGELPYDLDWLGKIAADISYFNAKTYFPFSEEE